MKRPPAYRFLPMLGWIVLAVTASGMTVPTTAPATSGGGMAWHEAVILGLVEGLTEFLPVSSTGHLILTQRILGMSQSDASAEAAGAYAICIQAGAILAVACLYFRRLRQVAAGVLGADAQGRTLGINLGLAFLPAAVVGLTAEGWIKRHLFGGGTWGLWPVIGAWFVGGLGILLMTRWIETHRSRPRMPLESATARMALCIGLAQSLALWPGISRSLATLLGGLWVGLSIPAAVEFSFLLGLITLGASTAYDAFRSGALIVSQYGWFTPLLGMVTALLSALLAIRWMLRYLQRHPLTVFGYYRILLALAATAFILL